ncbi:hypothetical protein [Thalassotalea ganghwensis]
MTSSERRKKQDNWTILLKVLAVASWLLFTFALIMSYYAAPEPAYGVVRYHGLAIREFWLTPLTGYLYVMLWLSALISYVSLILNRYRARRKTDNKHYNLWLLFFICVAWIVYIMIEIIKMNG